MKIVAAILIAGFLWTSCASNKEVAKMPTSIMAVDTTFTAEGDTIVMVRYEQHRNKVERRTFWTMIGVYTGVLVIAAIQLTK